MNAHTEWENYKTMAPFEMCIVHEFFAGVWAGTVQHTYWITDCLYHSKLWFCIIQKKICSLNIQNIVLVIWMLICRHRLSVYKYGELILIFTKLLLRVKISFIECVEEF